MIYNTALDFAKKDQYSTIIQLLSKGPRKVKNFKDKIIERQKKRIKKPQNKDKAKSELFEIKPTITKCFKPPLIVSAIKSFFDL